LTKQRNIWPQVAVVSAVAGIVLFGASAVYAQNATGQYPPIVQKLADRFGLNVNDVKAFFDQNRQEHKTQMDTKFQTMLDTAVKDGKLTDAQRKLILAKRQELQAQRQNNMDKIKSITPDERKKEFQTQQENLKNWASQNGIDIQYLFGGFGMRGRGHFMK
jgi:hypothetical protein